MRARHQRMLAITLSMLSACSGADGGGGGVDAGSDAANDAVVDTGFAPTPPDIPWLDADGGVHLEVAPPVFTPCPAGWRELTHDTGVTTCEPWPEGGHQDCGAGQAHFPGSDGCAPVGSACPAGEWAEDLPDDGSVLFVRAGATAGEGTRAAPYGGVGEALSHAAGGRTVALARGVFDEIVSVPANVTLRGACAAETRIQFSGVDPRAAIVMVQQGGVSVRDLSIGPSAKVGVIVLGERASVLLAGVVVDHTSIAGLDAEQGGTLEADRLVVRETQPDSTGRRGQGLNVSSGGQVRVQRVLLLGNVTSGIALTSSSASVIIRDAAIIDTRPSPSGINGFGFTSFDGAHTQFERVVFEANHDVALFARGGSVVSAEDVIIRDTGARERDGDFGEGVEVLDGATLSLSRVVLSRNLMNGMRVDGAGARVDASDLLVTDTAARILDMRLGIGLAVTGGAAATLARTRLCGNHSAGLLVFDPETHVEAADLAVVGTLPQASDGRFGYGLDVSHGGRLTVSTAFFDHNHTAAVFAQGSTTQLALSDAWVRRTEPDADGLGGMGLWLGEQAMASLVRAAFQANRVAAVAVLGAGTVLESRDWVAMDTRSEQVAGTNGLGLFAADAASVHVRRALFTRNRQVQVAASVGAELELADVTIRDSLVADCAGSGGACPDGAGGVGLGAYTGAHVVARSLESRGAQLCGVQVALDGELDLVGGEVAGNQIGACVQVDGYDVTRLTLDVDYHDNVSRDVESTTFPVPSSPNFPDTGLSP